MPLRLALLILFALTTAHAQLAVDETPGEPGSWGFRPAEDEVSDRNPPPFSWRPQEGAVSYSLQVARDAEFSEIVYEADDIVFNVHCPPQTIGPHEIFWRFRYINADGAPSQWSRPRRVVIAEDAVEFPLPPRGELLARIPTSHPRLFLRPEDLPRLRELAGGELKEMYDQLIAQCEKLLEEPPDVEEPPKYPEGTVRLSEEWRTIWWGNRLRTIAVLDNAATLGFVYQLSGDERFGQEARRLIMAAASWDPLGATGYRYNDEAGMPFAKYFSRAYSFAHELLTEEERAQCREVMTIRGREMYNHLRPRHLWRPYGSHSNRAWHFLGEIGIAFKDEIPDADDWIWFAMNVFANVYPVWSDSDGGWHEGVAYWRSYLSRFTWWADIMQSNMGVDAFRLPFFSQAGYYAIYLQPPGTRGGGFADQNHRTRSAQNVQIMSVFAAQAQNPHWQWYVEAHGGAQPAASYVNFLRAGLPEVEPRPPTDLPTSRLFRGTGVAMLNTSLFDAKDNVQVLFKSSPFGTISHGYDGQNAFTLTAFGERVFLSSGERDIHGSDHHTQWMWHTKSVNSITVGGDGQIRHSPLAIAEIVEFHASDEIDFVRGEAGESYEMLDQFERSILFVKPSLVVIVDRLASPQEQTFEWWLHAPQEFEISDQTDVHVTTGNATCAVAFHAPAGLNISQTDQFDPPPRERVQLTQYHLTAETSSPAREMIFITTFQPYRSDATRPQRVMSESVENGVVLRAPLPEGEAIILIRTGDDEATTAAGFTTTAAISAAVLDASGDRIATFGDISPTP